jgi:hypothetical protein
MASDDIFRQRPSISPNEFDGGGTDDSGEINAMRSHLHGGVQMTGNVPQQVQAAMNQQPQFANHPLNQPMRQDEFQLPPAMTEANAMYQNARKLMQQPQDQQPPQIQQFNPEFNPQQTMQQNKMNDFKDPRYEEVMKKLIHVGFDEIELPSRGKFYLSGEGPSNGILHIRPMTGKEEQILTTPRYVKTNQTLNMIFKECIGEQINPELLLSEDRTFILIYLRGISYSPIYDVEIKCPDCTKPFQNQIHLNSLDVDFCQDDFDSNDLYDTLPKSKLKIKYRLSTGRDESIVQEHRNKRIKDWGAEVTDDTTIFRSSLLIEEIDGITNKVMIQQIVSHLPISDMSYLRELLYEPPFGVNTTIGVICPHCSHEFEIEMPMELGFFFPKQKLQRKKRQQA